MDDVFDLTCLYCCVRRPLDSLNVGTSNTRAVNLLCAWSLSSSSSKLIVTVTWMNKSVPMVTKNDTENDSYFY